MTDDEAREWVRDRANRDMVVRILQEEARMRSHWWLEFVRREVRLGWISLRDVL